jgi:uncharacterized protein (DUF885 family)
MQLHAGQAGLAAPARQGTRRAGPRFDIRKFHDAGLLPGAMPLPVLDQCIDAYIAKASA